MLGLADQDVGQSVRNALSRTLLAGSDGAPLPVESWPGLRALQGETVRNLDIGVHRDGRTTWLSTSAVPIVLAGGACGGAAVTLLDVTMLRTLEQHHEQMIRLVSHDIRNPLTSVHLNAQLLQKALTERGLEKEQRFASVVIAAARRLDAMIEELVDSSRVRSGQLRLELRPVAIEHMLPEILARNARSLDTTRVRLALPDGPVLITADIVRLERALISVLLIALQNCADGAEVTLRVAAADDEVRFAVVVPGRTHASADPPSPPSSQLDQLQKLIMATGWDSSSPACWWNDMAAASGLRAHPIARPPSISRFPSQAPRANFLVRSRPTGRSQCNPYLTIFSHKFLREIPSISAARRRSPSAIFRVRSM